MKRILAASALLGAACCGGLALAQDAASETAALAQAKREAEEAAQRSVRLEQQAAAATSEAEKANASANALVARIEAAEAGITGAEARIRIIEERRAAQRARLAEDQQPLIKLTAALQTMARRPPALALVQPGTVSDVIHVRSLLASTLPRIRAQTASLRAEMAEADRLGGEAERAAAALASGREDLRRRRTALARLESRQRQRSDVLLQSALLESDRALAFTEEARELDAEAGSRRYRAEVEARLRTLAAPPLRPVNLPGDTPQRIGLAYRLPAEGRVVRGMGELSDAGVHARGLSLDVASGRPVVAPAGGRIVYAAPFRGYGRVVIIDHGGGWSSAITDLASIEVRPGAEVAAGAPIGRTGDAGLTVELRREGQPFPIAVLLAAGPRG